MNRNVIIVLAGGFVIALLVAMIVQASFGKKSDGGNKVQVAVATRALPVGTSLKDSDVKWKDWPEDSVFEGAIVREGDQKISEVVKGRLRRDVGAGEPVMQNAIAGESKGNLLMATMDPGMRAVSVKIPAESMVAGFLNPGDRVDVILTHQIRTSGKTKEAIEQKVTKFASETVLENIKVLAIDQVARKEDDKAKVGKTVTLEVDAAGAEKIALSASMGKIHLALRGLSDPENKSVAMKNRPATTDVELSKALKVVNSIKKNSGGSRDIVRVYSGDNVQNISVRR